MQRIIHQLRQSGVLALVVLVAIVIVLWTAGGADASGPLKGLLAGPPPPVISYQGLVQVEDQPYTGTGYFKFAIVNAGGDASYWSNDGTSIGGGEPTGAVALAVEQGLFNVLLGDTSLGGMSQPLDENALAETNTYLRLWFSPAQGGPYEQLAPDQRIASVAYALRARYADNPGPTGPAGPVNTTALTCYIMTGGNYPMRNAFLGDFHVIGEIIWFAGVDWDFNDAVPCDGQLLQISQYDALFSIIGTTYGGNGTTNFAVPNLNNHAPVGR